MWVNLITRSELGPNFLAWLSKSADRKWLHSSVSTHQRGDKTWSGFWLLRRYRMQSASTMQSRDYPQTIPDIFQRIHRQLSTFSLHTWRRANSTSTSSSAPPNSTSFQSTNQSLYPPKTPNSHSRTPSTKHTWQSSNGSLKKRSTRK